jgi:hypothetical protein
MIRSFSPVKVLLALCLAFLARGPVSAADKDKVDAAKRFLSNTDRAKAALFFAHPTATYNQVDVEKVSDVVDRASRPIPGAFAVTVRYTWKSLFDDANTSDLIFFFNARGRLTEIQLGPTTSFFKQFTGSDIVLNAIKDELEKKIDEWKDADARRTARTLIRAADTRGLLTLMLQMDQP